MDFTAAATDATTTTTALERCIVIVVVFVFFIRAFISSHAQKIDSFLLRFKALLMTPPLLICVLHFRAYPDRHSHRSGRTANPDLISPLEISESTQSGDWKCPEGLSGWCSSRWQSAGLDCRSMSDQIPKTGVGLLVSLHLSRLCLNVPGRKCPEGKKFWLGARAD